MKPGRKYRELRRSILSGIGIFVFLGNVWAQTTFTVTGTITDEDSGDELPGALIRVVGTNQGTISNAYGEFTLALEGNDDQELEVSFVGYEKKIISINSGSGLETLRIALASSSVQLEKVVITSQALGQMAAINQQIQANTIVNIVSRDKIESLPDQNAAESVGRLPGISIRREGGEGQQVIVRGLSPRFNAITINGERVPSTGSADRSFDLSTLSADALQGIEVYKSWTPNLEGDAIGGTVNFITKKAKSGWNGRARYLHGYNGQQNEFGQHRFNGDVGNRFFNDKIGVILSGNYQRADRSQDRISRDFFQLTSDAQNEGEELLALENINFEDRIETRDRFGATLALDYTFARGELRLFSNYSQTNRDRVRRSRRYRFDTRRQEYVFVDEETENRLIANTFSGKYTFLDKLIVSWSSSYSLTANRTPFNNDLRFRENAAFETAQSTRPTESEIIGLARNNLGETFLQRARSDEDDIDFERITGQVDLEYPLNLSRTINAKVKGGVKLRVDDRSRDLRRFQARASALEDIAEDNPGIFDVNVNQITISNFLGDFEAEDFLQGDFFLGPGAGEVNGGHIDQQLSNEFLSTYLDSYSRDLFADGGDYFADEEIRSAYVMTDLAIGRRLNVLVGVRNETTDLDYRGFSVSGSASSSEIDIGDDPRTFVNDSSASRSYSEWLPAINVKYKVSEWFDVRAAATKTLSRPNFLNLVPFESINLDQRQLQRGNFDLQHQVSFNYDLFFSFYNKFGLFTVGGFYKEIEDIDFVRRSRVIPITPNTDETLVGFDLIQPENAEETSKVRGIELDFQANLSSLPVPWNGIVFSANATFISSETPFPSVIFASNPSRPVNILREGTLPGQPDQVYNISLGYEKGGFSGRVSLIHQANAFGFPNSGGDVLGGLEVELDQDEQLDAFTGRTTRIDMSFRQRLYKNLLLIFNANNITNQKETEFIRDRSFSNGITDRREFGFTLDLGLQYEF